MSVINDDLQTTKRYLVKSNNELEESKKTIKTMDEKLMKSIKEKNEMEERIDKLFQTPFHMIKKSTNPNKIAKTLPLKPTFENLLPLLKNNYRNGTIELNGQVYEFVGVSRILEEKSCSSYKKRLEIILESMEIAQIYSVNDRECYFKLKFNDRDKFYVSNGNVKEIAKEYITNIANDLSLIHI